MKKRKVTIGIVSVLILVLGAAWALGYFHRGNPAFAELNQLRDQMRTAPEADRQRLGDQFRQKLDGLSEGQRREFFESNRGQFRQDMQKRMTEFFAMSPADQNKRLDDIIDQMQKWQQRAANSGTGGGVRNGQGGGGWPGGGGRNMTDGAREQARKQFLDNSNPADRGMMDKFGAMLGARMQQRGIQPPAGGGPPGFFR